LAVTAGTHVIGGCSGVTDPWMMTATSQSLDAEISIVVLLETGRSGSYGAPHAAQSAMVNFQFTACLRNWDVDVHEFATIPPGICMDT